MMLAPGCRWMLTITAGVSFIQAAWRTFSMPSIDVGDVRQIDRRAVAVGDDQLAILVAGQQLIVGADGVGLPRCRRSFPWPG